MFEIAMPGLFVVRYRTPGDMAPERQALLIEEIRRASVLQDVVLVFVIGEAVLRVDFAVPTFWLKVMGNPSIRIRAMGMVTDSKAVEIAARSFGAATRFRRSELEVRTFGGETEALAWARAKALAAPAVHP